MSTDFNPFRSHLESKLKYLMEGLELLKASVHRTGGNPLDEVEVATERFELEKKLTLEKRIRNDLAAVEHALGKFEKGTYGLCDNCGLPIGTARLEALPQANLCLSCKAREEKAAKGGLISRRERLVRYDEKVHILNFNVLDELVESVDDMADELEVRES